MSDELAVHIAANRAEEKSNHSESLDGSIDGEETEDAEMSESDEDPEGDSGCEVTSTMQVRVTFARQFYHTCNHVVLSIFNKRRIFLVIVVPPCRPVTRGRSLPMRLSTQRCAPACTSIVMTAGRRKSRDDERKSIHKTCPCRTRANAPHGQRFNRGSPEGVEFVHRVIDGSREPVAARSAPCRATCF
jgi:hypothetical protein